MNPPLDNLAIVLAPLLATAAISAGMAVRGRTVLGTSLAVGSAVLAVLFWGGLKNTCAIALAECLGGQATLFIAGLLYLLIVGVTFLLVPALNRRQSTERRLPR